VFHLRAELAYSNYVTFVNFNLISLSHCICKLSKWLYKTSKYVYDYYIFKEYFKCLAHLSGKLSLHIFSHTSVFTFITMTSTTTTTTTTILLGFNGTVLHFSFETQMNATEWLALPWQLKKKSLYFQGTWK